MAGGELEEIPDAVAAFHCAYLGVEGTTNHCGFWLGFLAFTGYWPDADSCVLLLLLLMMMMMIITVCSLGAVV